MDRLRVSCALAHRLTAAAAPPVSQPSPDRSAEQAASGAIPSCLARTLRAGESLEKF
ncbi:MAG TPA: hypothetical protein VL025_14620 [Thermoanaerobaculia bacterium]|nr:hypothetical protein [Thermoanaerobaculia bacterium]